MNGKNKVQRKNNKKDKRQKDKRQEKLLKTAEE